LLHTALFVVKLRPEKYPASGTTLDPCRSRVIWTRMQQTTEDQRYKKFPSNGAPAEEPRPSTPHAAHMRPTRVRLDGHPGRFSSFSL